MDYSDNPYLRILDALSSPDLNENNAEKPKRSNRKRLTEQRSDHGRDQRSNKRLLTGNRTNTNTNTNTSLQKVSNNQVAKHKRKPMNQKQSAKSYMEYANYIIEGMENDHFNGMWFVSEDEMPFYESVFGAYRQEESGYGEEFTDSYFNERKQYNRKENHKRERQQKQEQEQEPKQKSYNYSYTPRNDDTAFDRMERKRTQLLSELGLPATASVEDAKRKYRTLMLKYHPDKIVNESKETQREYEERAKSINEAYDKIKNQEFL